ncbi:MAG TPA: arginine repressor [Clostridiales bacterium]|nr:arginine repressor [Clostridiales bacterium]
MTKKQRLEKICSLINEYEISTQEELTAKLNECGFNVSQATVSRDINELNLVKSDGAQKKSKYVRCLDAENEIPRKIIDLFKQITVSIATAGNLIVIKTLNGNGGAVGMAIDEMKFSKILGTVAGDDTLLIVTKNEADAEHIVKTLRML